MSFVQQVDSYSSVSPRVRYNNALRSDVDTDKTYVLIVCNRRHFKMRQKLNSARKGPDYFVFILTELPLPHVLVMRVYVL